MLMHFHSFRLWLLTFQLCAVMQWKLVVNSKLAVFRQVMRNADGTELDAYVSWVTRVTRASARLPLVCCVAS